MNSWRAPTSQWWILTLLGVVAGTLGLGLFHLHAPGAGSLFPGCVFYKFTGIYCTGCGMTRASYALAHGQIMTAMSMNPLGILSLPAVAWIWVDKGLGHPPAWERIMKYLTSAKLWATLVISFTVLRNLPWPPFSWLAPG